MSLSRGNLCFTLVLAVCQVLVAFADSADAQQTSSRRAIGSRSTEKAARASWQPVRAAEPVSQANDRSNPRRTMVRHASAQEEAPMLPPKPAGSVSVVEDGLSQPIVQSHTVPMDGQIVLSPIGDGAIHDGAFACDGLPGGTCGCADGSCGGIGCDSMGCDGSGCDAIGCNSCGVAGCGELIGGNAWRPCATICLPQDGWFSAEYLSWWQDGMALPPLVSSNTGTVTQAQAGVIGAPGYQTLFGDGEVLTDSFDGARIGFGVWLDKCHTWGVGAEFFQIGQETLNYNNASTGSPILARPFFNTATGLEDAELIAFPNVVSGSVNVDVASELQGWGVHVKRLRCADEGCSKWLFCGCPEHFCRRTEGIFGYRGLQLDESVVLNERLTGTAGEGFVITDSYRTRNQFNGVDLGWNQRLVRGYWTLDTGVRLALGNTKQTVTINGSTVTTDPNATPVTETFVGGLLTQPNANIGTHTRDEFSVVPELNAKLGYQLTDNLRATIGYTFIYWSNVVRPGQHISTDANPGLFPPAQDPLTGVRRPAFAFDSTDYWVQGISVGGEYRW